MASKDQERENFLREAEGREAGVIDLLELYSRVEKIYSTASRALEEQNVTVASNSTNRTQPQRAHLG